MSSQPHSSAPSELANWKVYLLMCLMLLFGATNTIIHKFQNELTTNIEGVEWKYKHPFFQALCMFIAEFSTLGVYYIYEWRTNKKYGGKDNNPEIIEARKNGLKTEINVLLIGIPACFDIIGSSLMFIALTMIAASIYQMMRGCLVFIIAIMSVLFLKRILYRHHWSSLLVILIGLALVGASPLIYPEDKKEGEDNETIQVIIGIALIIVAQLFSGMHFVTEEKLFSNYYLHPLKVVGWEGAWGTLVYIILLVIFQFIT
jgi:drug/metabolite transporter (DMT)-like permease